MSFKRSQIKACFFTAALLVSGSTFLSAKNAEISNRSPDKRYALWEQHAGTQPYFGDVKLIDAKSGQTIVTLGNHVEPFSKKLLWSKDSQRMAYFNDASFNKDGLTRVFFRNAGSFKEVNVPELPVPLLPAMAASRNDPEARTRVEPLRWTGTGELVLEKETISSKWGRAALEITISFDPQHQATIKKSEPELPSVVDYMLLLPPDTFETSARSWLYVMRANGNIIDKKNGYMNCPGDGAQPEFEIALFRYRDGRPLLALCTGELEGDDSVSLQFFELGSDGKMQPLQKWPFPISMPKYDPETSSNADWQFNLPRAGKTITIRSNRNGHKVLYRLTWNGERFEKEK